MRGSCPRAVAVIAIAVLAAACGTTTQYRASAPRLVVKNPALLLTSSAEATNAAKTSRLSGTMAIDSPQFPEPLRFTMDGTLALDNSRGELRIDASSFLATVPDAPAHADVEARIIDGVVYVNFGELFGALAHGQPLPPSLQGVRWLKVDTPTSATPSGASPESFTQYLEFLRGVAPGGVHEVGADTIRGVATTHFAAEVDRARLREQLDKTRAGLTPSEQKLLDQSTAEIGDHTTVDVWIGNDDRLVHRLMVALDISASGETMHATMSMDLYDFGVTVDVHVPPPDEVRNLSELADLAAGRAGGVAGV